MDPARFALTLRELLSLEKTELKERISYIRENQKLDPSALFATQYAEAIKVKEGVDPVILKYEDLTFAYRDQNFSEFNRLVNELYDLTTKRAGSTASTLSFEKTFNGFEPFYRSAIAYVVIFLVAAISWLIPAFKRDSELVRTLRNSA